MIPQVQVRRCVPGDDGGAAQLYKPWRRCSGVMQQQAAPRHLKDTRPDVNTLRCRHIFIVIRLEETDS